MAADPFSLSDEAGLFMESSMPADTVGPLVLDGKTAEDLMTPSVVTIAAAATLQEAAELLTHKHLSAVPVLSKNGEPVGVLSRTDIVAHDCLRFGSLQPEMDRLRHPDAPVRLHVKSDPIPPEAPAKQVWEIMNPVFFSVARQTPAAVVIDVMVSLHVHRLFVQNDEGNLVGVVSTTDVLRHLQPAPGKVVSAR